ncbi:MAG: YdcF family protein [Candidatus Sulfotelmatobacter sp.]
MAQIGELVTRPGVRKYLWIVIFIFVAVLLAGLAAQAGSFLVVDAPRRSEAILVLAGETDRRPQRALELLSEGYGRRVVLDVPNNAKLYEFTQIELAQKYIHDLPQAAAISICAIEGLSTKDEAKEAERCLQRQDAKSVLIVTSDFHTRRALQIFRREFPGREFSVAAARNDEGFGSRWWTHRQWAKTFVDEWLRLIWWKAIDQWR